VLSFLLRFSFLRICMNKPFASCTICVLLCSFCLTFERSPQEGFFPPQLVFFPMPPPVVEEVWTANPLSWILIPRGTFFFFRTCYFLRFPKLYPATFINLPPPSTVPLWFRDFRSFSSALVQLSNDPKPYVPPFPFPRAMCLPEYSLPFCK